MTINYLKNQAINAAAVTDAASGDGATGYQYGSGHYLYLVKTLLVASGVWTMVASSTRTSGLGTVANGVSNSDLWTTAFKVAYEGAWISLRNTITGRTIVLQRGSTAESLYAKIAWAGSYNIAAGGTATRVPALAGEQVVWGTGPDATYTPAAFFPGAGSFTFQGRADSTTDGFWSLAYPVAGGTVGASGFLLALDPIVASSGPAGADSAVWHICGPTTPALSNVNDDASSTCWARTQYGTGSVAPARVKQLAVGTFPNNSPPDPRTSDKLRCAIQYQRSTAPADHFGVSSLMQWYGPAGPIPRTMDVGASVKAKLIAGIHALDWDGTEPS